MDIREFSVNLQKIYQEMSQTFSDFQAQAKLPCIAGCGRCCLNPEVEASVLEMLPLALRFMNEGKMEEWLTRLETSDQKSCLLYVSTSPDRHQGQCGVYQERPSLCRMFGVAGYFDKYRKATLSVCRDIKDKNSEAFEVALQELDPEKTPMLTYWTSKLSQLHPDLIQDRMPINDALRGALEKLALYARYHEAESDRIIS